MDTTTPASAAPSSSSPPSAPPPVTTGEDKTVAILSYITLFGFIAAIIINSSKKTQLGAFHLRQALGIFLTWMGVIICDFVLIFIPILGWLAILALWISVLVMIVMGLVSAVRGEMKPVPVLGQHYQKWFGTAFN